MNAELTCQDNIARSDQIRSKLAAIKSSLQISEVTKATDQFTECRDALTRLQGVIKTIEGKLDQIPPIDVAVLGPSRHGKSTLLNALVTNDLLPTSDVKPCTASILKMTYALEWSVRVQFVAKDQLVDDWKEAVRDAKNELAEQENEGIANADPSFVRNVLQRFVTLFEIDSELPSQEMLGAVRSATIPSSTAKLLGTVQLVQASNIPGMKKAIKKYLSTEDISGLSWPNVKSPGHSKTGTQA